MSVGNPKPGLEEDVSQTASANAGGQYMRLKAVVFAACALATVLFLQTMFLRGQDETEVHPLRVAPAVFEAKAAEGATLRATFTVTNTCGDVVRILGAASSCGCTAPESTFPIAVKPGESVPLTFKVTTGPPNSRDNIFAKEARMFIDRAGNTPELRIRIAIVNSPQK